MAARKGLHVTVSPKDLRASIKNVAPAILKGSGSKVHPAAQRVLISAQAPRWVTVACSGVRSSVERTIVENVPAARARRQGQALLPVRSLLALLAELDDEPITIEAPPAGPVVIAQGERTIEISPNGVEPSDFPDARDLLGSLDETMTLTASAESLADALPRAARAASQDEARPMLTGVLLDVPRRGARTIQAVATDSYRLAAVDLELAEPAPKKLRALIPAGFAKALARAVRGADTVKLYLSGSQGSALRALQASFMIGERVVTWTTLLVEQHVAYPDWRALTKKPRRERAVEISREPLTAALRRAAALAAVGGDGYRVAVLVAEPTGAVRLEAKTATTVYREAFNGAARLQAPPEEEIRVAFNPDYLLSGLDLDDTARVELHLRDGDPGLAPVRIASERGRFLVMPIRLPGQPIVRRPAKEVAAQ